MKYSTQQRGYTLLFAVLTATLVLGVTIFILSVSKKQFALSNIARESMFAIYAADSGVECIASDPYKNATTSNSFICDGKTITKTYEIVDEDDVPHNIETTKPIYRSKFSLGFRNTTGGDDDEVYGCAVVTGYYYVDTSKEPDLGGQAIITSRGYNLCTYSGGQYAPDTTSPRTVERAMQLEYH
jgi:hypothetical protein